MIAIALAMVLASLGGPAGAQVTKAPPEDFRPLLPPDDVPFNETPVPSASPADTVIPPAVTTSSSWLPQGPAPLITGQVEHVETFGDGAIFNDVAGPVNVILPHPNDDDLVYIGTVNGGVWRTQNATATPPSWEPLTDQQRSLSIGALDLDPLDSSLQTLMAGIGRTSSYGFYGGRRTGLIRSTDGGLTWNVVGPNASDPGFTDDLLGANILGVAARGMTFVVAVDDHDSFASDTVGVFRSTDGGQTFAQVMTLPLGIPRGFATDPNRANVLYVGLVPGAAFGQPGVFRSTDTGATWTKISDATIDGLLQGNGGGLGTRDIAIVPGVPDGQVFTAIVNREGSTSNFVERLANPPGQFPGVFRTQDGGGSWDFISFFGTNEGGFQVFLNPAAHVFTEAGQGRMHFALAAHPVLTNLLFMGGDRQAHSVEVDEPLPPENFQNSLGAADYTARIFRGDLNLLPGDPWRHITHSSAGSDSGGTRNTSAPHADTRDLIVDGTNDLLAADDGGIYRQNSPETKFGKWISMNGDVQIAELHRAEWSRYTRTIVGATVDNGVAQQVGEDGLTWRSMLGGVGGGLAVDNESSAQVSFRFMSLQNFGSFRLALYDGGNNLAFQSDPINVADVNDAADITDFDPQFITPIAPNRIDPERVAFAGNRRVFVLEQRGVPSGSQTQPNMSVVATTVGDIKARAMVFGGLADNGTDDVTGAGALYVAAGNQVLFANVEPDPPVDAVLAPLAALPGGLRSDQVRDVVMDPDEFTRLFAVTASDVLFFDGGTWTVLTDNLDSVGDFHSIEYLTCAGADALVVGSDLGVFVSLAPNFNSWEELGTSSLPNAPVLDLDFDLWDVDIDPNTETIANVLVAGTLGRGAFVWKDVCSTVSGGPATPARFVDFSPRAAGVVESMFGLEGEELGNPAKPFTTLQRAVNEQAPGGRIVVKSGESAETLTVSKPLRIVASGGPARIGAPQ